MVTTEKPSEEEDYRTIVDSTEPITAVSAGSWKGNWSKSKIPDEDWQKYTGRVIIKQQDIEQVIFCFDVQEEGMVYIDDVVVKKISEVPTD